MTNNNTPAMRPVGPVARNILAEMARLGISPSGYLLAYLEPLTTLTSIGDCYGLDQGVMVAAYCLDALQYEFDWESPAARRLTKELRDQVASVYGEDFDGPCVDELDEGSH